jgi:hypothetical protein
MRIDADIKGTLLEETFWHEVSEAIDSFNEMRLPHAKVSQFGLGLQQIMASMEFTDG